MKWYPKTIKQALIPILVLNWITGLGLVEYPVGNSRKKLYSICIFIITVSLWIANYIFESQCSSANVHNLDVMVFTTLRYFNTLTASFSLIVGWFSRQKMQLCIETLEIMNETFESLDVAKNYQNIFRKSLFWAIIWLILIFSVYVADVYFHLFDMELIHSMYCVFCFQWSIHINTVVDIAFISVLSCIASGFTKINCLLHEKDKHPVICAFNWNKKRKKISISVPPSNLDSLITKKALVDSLKHLHLELCKTTKEINNIYDVQIVMEMITNFVSITAILYYFQNIILIQEVEIKIKIANIIALILWGIIYFLRFLHVNIISEGICNQANETGNIILHLKQLNNDTQMAEEMEQFNLQLTQNPLTVQMYGLNIFGYRFLVKFLGQVTIYLVILIQMRRV